MRRAIIFRSIVILLILGGIGCMSTRIHPAYSIFVTNGHTTVDQRVKVESNTGMNDTITQGSVESGNAAAHSIIDTTVNTTVISCCETPKPTQKPTTPPNTPTPTSVGTQPSPTPTTPSGGNGTNGGGDGKSGSLGGIGGSTIGGAAIVNTPAGDVLGLSTTSSDNLFMNTTFGFGLICVGIGINLIHRRIGI